MALEEFKCCSLGHSKIFNIIWRPFRKRRRTSLEPLFHPNCSASITLSLIYISLIVFSDFVMVAKCEQWSNNKRLVDSEDSEAPREPLSSSDLDRLHQLVKIGLNITNLPNVAQVNTHLS